ncbi:MAG: YdeI/OmpD-associated family protein [Alloacidobacterium sp.]
MTDKSKNELQRLAFASQKTWEKWLKTNHLASPGVWLQLAKKASGTLSVTYAEAIETALCYGWIDGQKQSHNAEAWLQKFTPRGRKSIWSKINCEKASALIENGRMKPAGLAEVERAKQDGRWEQAYDSPSSATVPPDLQAALNKSPRAKAFFATLESRNRYAILWRVQTAKKTETRSKRIALFVEMLERGEKLHP